MQTYSLDPHDRELLKSIRNLLLSLISVISKGDNQIMADLTGLTNEVARNTSVVSSALVLIQGFAAQLAAAGTDPVKLKALQDSLTSNDDQLAAAVAANTPAV